MLSYQSSPFVAEAEQLVSDSTQRDIARCAARYLREHAEALACEGANLEIERPHPVLGRLVLSRDGRNLIAAVYLATEDGHHDESPDCEGIGTDPESTAVSLKLKLSYLFAEM